MAFYYWYILFYSVHSDITMIYYSIIIIIINVCITMCTMCAIQWLLCVLMIQYYYSDIFYYHILFQYNAINAMMINDTNAIQYSLM